MQEQVNHLNLEVNTKRISCISAREKELTLKEEVLEQKMKR